MIKRIGILSFLVFFTYNTIWAIETGCYSAASTACNLAQIQYFSDIDYCDGVSWTSVCNREADRKYDAALYQIGLDLDDCLQSASGG